MTWEPALLAAAIWILFAACWRVFRPIPESLSHWAFIARTAQDVLPAVLVGMLLGRLL